MARFSPTVAALRQTLSLAAHALRAWTARQVLAAVIASVAVALVVGVTTVLIPNPLFGREIPPVGWNYPAWIVASAITGMLIATYVRPATPTASSAPGTEPGRSDPAESRPDDGQGPSNSEERRTGRMGVVGTILAWFAVGCPVCNKLALIALGYTGAITWFAPVQPFLAAGAIVLSGAALVWRLRGQLACTAPPRSPTVVAR